ncbi:MAG: polyprenyl synthetase family protein [Campylobacter sp.]|nr:polyprenyl synthetase family protein [Campylobacter sp.]
MSFEEYLKANPIKANSFHPFFDEALNYTLGLGGKHFRAKLLLGVVEIFRPQSLENAMRVAYAVEAFHSYSLIHDDLPCMDNSPLRRGAASMHIKFDETTAVLVADALNTHAFYLIATSNFSYEIITKCVRSLSQNGGIGGMVIGQAIDCYFENKKLDFNSLKFLHIHKTAKLIAASLEMGAIISELDESLISEIYQIGLDLGLLFQINDDILDATKSSEEIGKTAGNDTHKNSFVNLLGLQKAKDYKETLIGQISTKTENLAIKNLINSLITKYLKD